MVGAYELIYNLRRAAEGSIVACDEAIRKGPHNDKGEAINPHYADERRHWARLVMRYQAFIERLERGYEQA